MIEVLVDAEGLVELPQRLLEAMRDASALDVIEAFVVCSGETIDDAERAGLRQEGVIIDEAPQRQERVDAPGFPMVLEDAADSHHHARLISHHDRAHVSPRHTGSGSSLTAGESGASGDRASCSTERTRRAR